MPTDSDKYVKATDPSVVSETVIQPSTLENIDRAIFEYIDEKFNIFTDTNKGFKKTPVIWVAAERSHQIKNKKELRDSNGVLILPLITVERTSMSKDPSRKGIFQANLPPVGDYRGGSLVINKRINQNKTQNFANADVHRYHGGKNQQVTFPRPNKKVVYQVMSIPMPVYIDINYSITLRTEYQEQMNQMVTPFAVRPGAINTFMLEREGHEYEAFIQQEFSQENNTASLNADERMYQTKIDVKVLGYLIGSDKNQEQPKVVIRENTVEVKMPRERVILGDIPEHIDERGFYRD